MRLISIAFGMLLTVAASADPPCQSRQVVCHSPVQQVIHGSIHAATIYHDTHLRIVEVPVPAFVFQTLTAYQPAVQQQVAAIQPSIGIGTDESLAALSAPVDHVGEIRQKCANCHSAQSGSSKGGLTLFDQSGAFKPSTSKANGLTMAMIAARTKSTGDDVMPPGANANPSKRLSLAASQYIEAGQ